MTIGDSSPISRAMHEVGQIRVPLRALAESETLAGTPAGREMLTKLLQTVSGRPEAPTRVYLDFSNIALATVSFLREGPFAFRNIVRRDRPLFYPIFANACDLVRDEIVEIIDLRNDVVILCNLDRTGSPTDAQILGNLDPKQKMTLELVHRLGEAGAPDLMRDYGTIEGTTHTTAWNNRLANLSAVGLLMEFTQGRAKRYRPVLGM